MRALLRPETQNFLRSGRLAARIDTRHALADRLQSCVVADGRCGVVDLARPRAASAAAVALRSRGPSASNWSIGATSSADMNFSAGGFSAAVVCYLNLANNSGNPQIFGRFSYTDESTNAGWGITQNNGVYGTLVMNNNGFASYLQTGSVAATVGVHTVGLTVDGTTKRLYVDGALDTATATGNQVPAASPTGPYFNGLNASSQANATEVLIGCVWSRLLSAAEMLAFHYDPFCLLRPRYPLPILLPIAGPTFAAGGMFAMFPP